jgi:hypothetical protein
MRLPQARCGVVAFEAATAGSIVVGLSPEQRVAPAMYEIVASRRECAVRREAQGRDDKAHKDGDALVAGGLSGDFFFFWFGFYVFFFLAFFCPCLSHIRREYFEYTWIPPSPPLLL